MAKKIIFLFVFICFFGCQENPLLVNCLQPLPLNIATDLNNPGLINLQTPGGFTEINGGAKGIFLFNINGTRFVAFDRICPNNDCPSPMTFEKGLFLECSCDKSQYSVHFNGDPQDDSNTSCPAREYKVTKTGSTLRISSF